MRPSNRPARLRAAALAAGLALVVAPSRPATAQIASAVTCGTGTPTARVSWPQGSLPLWTLDVVRPSRSTGPDGSGLEIRNVHYRGRLVLKAAHVPVLNVEYDPGGGCSCFRDWTTTETGYRVRPEAEGTPKGCVFEAEAGDVYTTCESNSEGGTGGDPGTFSGIAIEDFGPGEELVITGNMRAGWYRYRMKWHFYADGRIWPEFSFSAASATCTSAAHRHHAYWRLDFDLGGSAGDAVREENPTTGAVTSFASEVQRTWGAPADGVRWLVEDAALEMGYRITPSSADVRLPTDAFSKFDFAALRYQPGSVNDGGDRSSSCAISPAGLGLNNESLANQDVVVWYRSSALHSGGSPWECDVVGPMLAPTGSGVGNEPAPLVGGYLLERAYPNPFNPATSVRFTVAEAQAVTLALYDALGRRVAVLFEGFAEANHPATVRVDAGALPSGTYTVRLEGEKVQGSTRVVLVR